MRAQIVKGKSSKLHGAKCGLCTKPVVTGESVLWHDMPNNAYLERRLVFHTSCMAELVENAPAGQAAAAAAAEASRIREAMLATGSLYPHVA